MKRVFISHPYKDDPKGNKKRVDTICRGLAEKDDILPISPLHLFSFMDSDKYREHIMFACFALIDICDEVRAYGDNEGCREEMLYAVKKGKKVVVKHGKTDKAKYRDSKKDCFSNKGRKLYRNSGRLCRDTQINLV